MSVDSPVNLGLQPRETGVESAWTDAVGDVHVRDHGFDDYGTEVVHLDAPYDARDDVKALEWDATHRTWTGSEWRFDFAALDEAVEHFLERGYSVTITAPTVSIYVADFDAPFLDAHLPAEPPPDATTDDETGEQADLAAFDRRPDETDER